MNLDNYSVEDSTHNLICSHQYNRHSRVDYYMSCLILKDMPCKRYKLVVFGDHRSKDKSKKQIRYVSCDRVTIKQDAILGENND